MTGYRRDGRIEDCKSFEDVDFWISELRRDGPDEILIYVIGNKVDLEPLRVVDREVAESYAQTKGVFHFHSSAKTGQDVEEIFYHICQMEYEMRSSKENGGMRPQSTIDFSNFTQLEGKKGRHRGRCRCQST
ncbi:ras-related protein Rab-21-like [Strongylocentrotus purpuratus]|uniref:Uncharacterized protein n=1 Tax=Strongylocentrotus purpuratus TaxID=7668 RepID=A0A7M7NU90_STRPU|nr:ras-related protein Rab-21-like [Strongylocentrotus purpuratus]